jgi:hypothetical protein
MDIVIEVRHYVTPSGKDVFDDWLTRLADPRAQAKIAARIDRLAAGNFGDSKPLRESVYELRIDWGPAIESITGSSDGSAFCFCAVATSGSNLQTLGGRSGI